MLHSCLIENASASLRVCASAPRYSRTEDVCVLPVVVAELECGNVKRQEINLGRNRLVNKGLHRPGISAPG